MQSIWLWAIAGISIPIFIHLWNVRPAKTLKVGSIAFLTEGARAHSRSLRLSELLLLLLRCLLLIVLALLISKPFWERQVDVTKEKGWVLLEKQGIKQTYRTFKPVIDSLVDEGFSFHYFNKGFKGAKIADGVKTDEALTKEGDEPYWTLIKELNRQVPAKFPVYLFTGNSLGRFAESRPDVALNLHWNTYTVNDTSTWLEKAFITVADSIQVVLGNSNANGTYFTWHNISAHTANEQFVVSKEQGKTTVTYKHTSATRTKDELEVDTSELAVSIYADKTGNDANYLKAALDAIRDFTKRKIKTTIFREKESITEDHDWLFWLSENSVPAPLRKRNLFVYEQGKVRQIFSNMVTGNKAGETSGEDVQVFKMVEEKPVKNAYPVWKNGYGDALLSRENTTAPVYRFYSRFDPQWTDLTWSSRFPGLIYELLLSESKNARSIKTSDKRIVDERQIQPEVISEGPMLRKKMYSKGLI